MLCLGPRPHRCARTQVLCESQPGCHYVGGEEYFQYQPSNFDHEWYPNLFGSCVAADSDHVSVHEEEDVPEAGQVGLVDWGNCTWGYYVFDCSTLGETNPVGQFYDIDPWIACGTWSPPCDDLYMYQDPVPSIAQACAATCAEYQYVPQMSSKNLLTLVERLMRRVV